MIPSFVYVHALDPVFVHLGNFEIRWYGLMYVIGILFAWWYANRLIQKAPLKVEKRHTGDFITWTVIGIVVGGRLFYVLFYSFDYFFDHPWEIFMTWKGGMSFHGGLLGVMGALYLFSRRHQLPFVEFADLIALTVPMGICFGRIGNFMNGEHWGRITDVPWAMIFPQVDEKLRHPSQLYEAFLEGLLLFMVLNVLNRVFNLRQQYQGLCAGLFALFYAGTRMISECFRDPDGYWQGLTLGQAYSIPLIFMGAAFCWYAFKAHVLQRPS